jgi:hypothetical protein
MTETTDAPGRIRWLPVVVALAATVLVTAMLTADGVDLLKSVAPDWRESDKDARKFIPDLFTMTEKLVAWATPVTIATAPLAMCAGAAMWQWGGQQASRRAVPVMFSAVGAVLVVVTARGLAA